MDVDRLSAVLEPLSEQESGLWRRSEQEVQGGGQCAFFADGEAGFDGTFPPPGSAARAAVGQHRPEGELGPAVVGHEHEQLSLIHI